MNSHWLRRTTYTHQNKPALSLHYPLTTNTHMKGPITVIHHRKATSHAHSRHQTISPYGNQPRPERLSHSGVSLPYLSFVCFTPPCITSSIPLRQAVISLVRFHLSYLANLSPDRQISANLWSLSGSLPSCLSRLQHLSWRAIFFFPFFLLFEEVTFQILCLCSVFNSYHVCGFCYLFFFLLPPRYALSLSLRFRQDISPFVWIITVFLNFFPNTLNTLSYNTYHL